MTVTIRPVACSTRDRIIENIDHDHVTRLRVSRLALRNQDAMRDSRVVGYDESDAAFTDELAGDSGGCRARVRRPARPRRDRDDPGQ